MKVAILGGYPINKNEIGGVQTYLYNLAGVLSKNDNIDPHVLVMGSHNKTWISNGLTIHIIKRIKIPLSNTFWNVYPLIKKINEIKPEIIHCHNAFPPYSLATLILKKEYPTLFTVLGIIEKEKNYLWQKKRDFPKKLFYPLLEKFVYTNLNNIVVLTPYVEYEVKKIILRGPHIFYTVAAGVSLDFYQASIKKEKDRLLYVGVIEPRKGILDLLKTIKKLKIMKPDINLHIVGKIKSYTYYQQLLEYIEENNLSNHIWFHSNLSKKEILNEYEKASIFILPSYEESFGIVLLEAMATGTPIIATSVGGIPYVVQEKVTGYLVNPGDIENIIKYTIKLLNDENERKRMGKNGIKHASKFKWENIGKQIIHCYEEVIEAYT